MQSLEESDRDIRIDDFDGCVLIDHDCRTLLFQSEDSREYESFATRRLLIELMRVRWPGWEIRWAGDPAGDLIAHLQLEPMPQVYRPPGPITPRVLRRPDGDCLLSVRTEAGAIIDRRFEAVTDNIFAVGEKFGAVLSVGPQLFLSPDLLEGRSDPLPPEEGFENEPDGPHHLDVESGIIIDLRSRLAWYWSYDSELFFEPPSSAWEGYETCYSPDGPVTHGIVFSRPYPQLPVPTTLRRVEEILVDDPEFDPPRAIEKATAKYPGVVWSESALNFHDGPLTSAQRRELFDSSVQQWLASRDSSA